MSKVESFRNQRPIEDTMEPAEWRLYLKERLQDGSTYTDEEKERARWIFMKTRRAIHDGTHLTRRQIREDLALYEGPTDMLFTDGDPGVNKAKLRVGKYRFSWLLSIVRAEMVFFIAEKKVLRHKKHMTQDANLG